MTDPVTGRRPAFAPRAAAALVVALSGLLLGACSTTYREPVFAASAGASTDFPGVVDLLSTERPLDVLFVHGMCSHDAGWAHGAVQGFYASLGGDAAQVALLPSAVAGSAIVLHQQTLSTPDGAVRANAIVWSPLTTPLKRQLCFDQTERSPYCTDGDGRADAGTAAAAAAEPYPYRRAPLNRLLKDRILDDCLSDALIYQGRSRDAINRQMQAAIVQALATSGATSAPGDLPSMARRVGEQARPAPLVVITDSLGSKVAFDALYKLARVAGDDSLKDAGRRAFERISHIFMQANQLPFLALADQQLDGSFDVAGDANAYPEDPIGALATARAARSDVRPDVRPKAGLTADPPYVVAFTDPNDVLSYVLAPSPHRRRQGYPVVDVVGSNAPTYLGVVELPTDAHLDYGKNAAVQRLIGCGRPESRRCKGR